MKLINLKKREKLLLILFLVIIIAVFYYRKFYYPQNLEYQKARQNLESAEVQKLSIESDMPDETVFEQTLKNKKNIYKIRLGGVDKQETKILTPSEITHLLKTVAKLGLDLDIEIVYIKSKEPAKKEKKSYYIDYLIDIHYISSFANSVEYISRLEKISDYLKIEDVKMEIEKEGESFPHTYLVLSTIINKKGPPQKVLKELMTKTEEMIQRVKKEDPFTTGEKPYKKDLPLELNLDAILLGEENQTAIINGEIKRVGDLVRDREIVEILPDRVILKEGNRLYELIRQK